MLDFAMVIPNLWSFLYEYTRVTLGTGVCPRDRVEFGKRIPPSCVTWEGSFDIGLTRPLGVAYPRRYGGVSYTLRDVRISWVFIASHLQN